MPPGSWITGPRHAGRFFCSQSCKAARKTPACICRSPVTTKSSRQTYPSSVRGGGHPRNQVFPRWLCRGPDGIRPQHLVELTVTENRSTPSQFYHRARQWLPQCTCPQDIAQLLFDGRLITMDKKSGSIRPIVVGYVWRCLAAKSASIPATNTLAHYFSPLQLGVGVPGGCEAAMHAEGISHRKCLQIIFSLSGNFPTHSIAYTELSCLIQSVRWFRSSTNVIIWRILTLQFDKLSISLADGQQQGDLLGGLLFFARPYIQSCILLPLPLRWVSWMMIHLGDLCPPYPQTLTTFVGREPK